MMETGKKLVLIFNPETSECSIYKYANYMYRSAVTDIILQMMAESGKFVVNLLIIIYVCMSICHNFSLCK